MAMVAAGQTLRKRYRVEAPVGQGGMGAVYRARDTALDVTVAVKELLDRSPEARDQFAREARLLARLSHPGLTRVTDWFVDGRSAYLVMDFVEGRDLQGRRVPVAVAVDWGLQVLDVLGYVHGHGVVHRDLKPSNLILRPDGRLVLVDFGIARDGGMMTSPFAHGACTPAVAPPEQCTACGRTDPSSDLYALGVTLYYLVSGRYPPDAMGRLLGTPVGSVGDARLDAVLERAMALDAADRYRTAADMAVALRGVGAMGAAGGVGASGGEARVAPRALSTSPPVPIFRREIRRP